MEILAGEIGKYVHVGLTPREKQLSQLMDILLDLGKSTPDAVKIVKIAVEGEDIDEKFWLWLAT